MALSPTFKITTPSACNSFYLTDTTPVYNSVSAVGGYGSPNLAAADITDISLTIVNMSDPTVSKTVIVPTIASTFDTTRIPGLVQYNIISTQTALATNYAVTAAVSSGVDISYTAAGHPYTIGQLVKVSGLSTSTYNCTGIVTQTSSTTFTINKAIASGTITQTGTSKGYTNTTLTVADNVYKFTYTVTGLVSGVSQTYTNTCYVVIDCTIAQTLDEMLKDLDCCSSCSDSNNKKLNMLYQAFLLRNKAQHLAACGDFTGAQDVLDCLTAMVGYKTCDNC